MIHPHLLPHLDRIAALGAFVDPMLMLGAQGSSTGQGARETFGRWVGDYRELDLDGGDLRLDLNADLVEIEGAFGSVFNLGTIEHVWNAHAAWGNALRAVRTGGFLISHGPANGWVGHGIHLTHPEAIAAFVAKNGFTVLDRWTSRWREQGEVVWLVARKERHIGALASFEPAWQVYVAGQKKAIR